MTVASRNLNSADQRVDDMSSCSGQSEDASSSSGSPIRLWSVRLSEVVGCSAAEIAAKVGSLLEFCAGQGISPERLIDECRVGPERIARRIFYLDAAARTPSSLAVQSFMIHNGINVFGDLICLPTTAEDLLREQGPQWKSTDHR
jgi:hypothetical protein